MTAQSLPEGSRYLTLVIRVPPPESPDYALLHQITRTVTWRPHSDTSQPTGKGHR